MSSAPEQIVVAGGGPAALAAARAYREAGGAGEVVLLCAEPHLPYRRPPLSKDLLRGDAEPSDLPIEDEAFFARARIDLRLGVRATAIDRAARTVTADGATLPYDALVLATGAAPRRPPIPGAEAAGVHTLRTRDDALALRAAAIGAGAAVVVGAGFIACEAAASLARRGVQVTLVAPEDLPQAARLGEDAGRLLAGWLADEGVALRLGTEVEAVAPGGVVLAGGERIDGAVLLATGVAPASDLAAKAGLALDDGAIAVDEHMRTEDPAVLAAGDVAAAVNATAGRRLHVEHWGDALDQGAVAGRVLAGEDARWSRPPGFWSQIGDRVLKHTSWGDGFDRAAVEADEPDRLVVRYERDGRTVGLLAHGDDDAYARARETLGRG